MLIAMCIGGFPVKGDPLRDRGAGIIGDRWEVVVAMNDQPTVHVAVADAACRQRIVDALHRQGWNIIEQPTGFHLLQTIADVIEGRSERLPGLLLVDVRSRGCSGLSIAAGLRELGVRIPLILVARPGDPVTITDDGSIRLVGPNHAVSSIAEIARELAQTADRASPGPEIPGVVAAREDEARERPCAE
jgi:hypothetical protein